MIKSTGMYDKVQDIRRVLTKPRVLSPAATKKKFEEYMRDTHNIYDLSSEDGLVYMSEFKKWPAMRGLLEYMGYNEYL